MKKKASKDLTPAPEGPKLIARMKGYKATDKDMKCRGFQFELGQWYEHEGDLVECQSGFHFCEHPSGVWAYYSETSTRVFEVEAELILETAPSPGADRKRVSKRIRFIQEITPGLKGSDPSNTGYGNTGNGNTGNENTGYGNTGNRNTGYGNTGNENTGYGNTGNRNTGNRNTGNENTGDRNTGYGNTGNGNTGDGNTGNENTGYRNTGNRNTGDRNTGNGNTGDGNTGNRNTGDGNATNHSAGFFCVEEPTMLCFDVDSGLTRAQFTARFPDYWNLCDALRKPSEINFEDWKHIPGITPEKLAALHEKHLKGGVK